MKYDYAQLLGRITAKKFKTQADFAAAMKMSARTLSSKLNNLIDFKQKEILKACELLDINTAEIPVYFFTPEVLEIRTYSDGGR